MTKPFIAICYPSRGTGFDATWLGVVREIEDGGYPHIWCPALYMPIPDAHNETVRLALADERVTHLWFVENDHLFPAGVLAALLALDAPIAAAEYVLRGGLRCVIESAAGVELVGLGCTLVKRAVFTLVPDPPFQVGRRQQWTGSHWQDRPGYEHAGGQDIFFCQQARKAGLRIEILRDRDVGHLELKRAGDHVNLGMDWIRCWGGAARYPYYPPKREDMMSKVVYLQAPGGLVIDMDTASTEYPRLLRQGWKEIEKPKATAALKEQEKANAATTAAIEERNNDDD